MCRVADSNTARSKSIKIRLRQSRIIQTQSEHTRSRVQLKANCLIHLYSLLAKDHLGLKKRATNFFSFLQKFENLALMLVCSKHIVSCRGLKIMIIETLNKIHFYSYAFALNEIIVFFQAPFPQNIVTTVPSRPIKSIQSFL